VPEAVETVPDPVPAPPPDTVPAEAPGPLAAEAPVVSPPTEEPLVIQRPPETEPRPESPAAPATPCEIAADELPQVGR